MKEKVKPRIHWEILILAFAGLLTFIFPFISYTYKRVSYSLSGYRFLTGITVLNGEVTLSVSGNMAGAIVLLVLIMIFACICKSKWFKLAAYAVIICSVLLFILSFLFYNGLGTQLSKASNLKMSYGLRILMIISVLVILVMGRSMYKAHAIGTLDLMALPCICYLLVNNYFPMAGLFIAFKKIDYSKGIWGSDWIGLDNFKFLFKTSDAWIMTRNTLLYNIAFIVLGNIIGICVAILLSEVWSRHAQKAYQTSILLPQLISMIIVSYIVFAFLSNESGFINNSLLSEESSINFYAEKFYWPFILIFINIWKGLGYSSIIYLSSVLGINRSLYEAAKVDGASKIQQIFKVTLPLLRPTIITLFIMQVGRIFFSDFGLFLQVPMDSGALYSVTQTIDTYVYRSLMTLNQVGMASAAGMYQSVVGFLVVITANTVVRKIDNENAMF